LSVVPRRTAAPRGLACVLEAPAVADRTRVPYHLRRMTSITIDLPDDVFAALRKSPREFALEMRIAAAVQWYSEGLVSQGKAAEIAGLSRMLFIDELARRKVSASQETESDLRRAIGA